MTARRRKGARRWVAVLTLVSVLLGAANLVKAMRGIRYAQALAGVPMAVPWPYLIVGGFVWGVVFLSAGIGLWRRRMWGRWLTLAAVTGYTLNVWLDRWLWAVNRYARQTRARDLVLSALLMAFVWAVLNRRAIRRTFEARDGKNGKRPGITHKEGADGIQEVG